LEIRDLKLLARAAHTAYQQLVIGFQAVLAPDKGGNIRSFARLGHQDLSYRTGKRRMWTDFRVYLVLDILAMKDTSDCGYKKGRALQIVRPVRGSKLVSLTIPNLSSVTLDKREIDGFLQLLMKRPWPGDMTHRLPPCGTTDTASQPLMSMQGHPGEMPGYQPRPTPTCQRSRKEPRCWASCCRQWLSLGQDVPILLRGPIPLWPSLHVGC
jgi:hypothetical protein